ncbi:ATP-binding protein [Psychrilyobacter atlanticus]|uniref:ATP-binding protein n=1 Tax=Psychrilyobacter atlanticus TaxID=271091 RepID=UPI00040375DE|nr:ATP-binding protein [Psychrilyobacter atlanticus]
MSINEIIIISGKGGTGKTTLAASLIPYLDDLIIADCDVDAPDLNILLDPQIKSTSKFIGLKKAIIDSDRCTHCGLCQTHCKFSAISKGIILNQSKCEGCGVCEFICPQDAISMKDAVVGELYESETTFENFVHAKLIPGEETSGKLVAEVRKKAKASAVLNNKKNIIVDGSPGIACNVISSITGASQVIIVTESTFSGLHDLKRIYELTKKFNLKVQVVINKFDLSLHHSEMIEKYCLENNIVVGLKIPFTKKIVRSIVSKTIPSVGEKDFFRDIGFFNFVDSLSLV